RQICAFGYRRYAALRGLSRGCVCACAGDQIRCARMMTRNGLMHLHILGICGSFMGGLAAIAKAAGHTVTGCDANAYPPMSTQLEGLGIALTQGYDASQLDTVARSADVFVVGNAISRGNPLLEAILDGGLQYTSGPQWLFENVLRDKWVLAVAGTHGKAIETQFHHLVRTVPHRGRLIVNGGDENLGRVLARGCWSEVERFGAAAASDTGPDWTIAVDGTIKLGGAPQGQLAPFSLIGRHNQMNALAAIAAAR